MDYTVTMASGETWTMRADFRRAADPIRHVDDEGTEYPTPYQVADARHEPQRAAEMLVTYWASQGGDAGDEVESVEVANPKRSEPTARLDLGEIEARQVSVAVARGRAVIDALADGAGSILLDTDGTDGDEDVWSEMVRYLGRRGVSVRYDHDAGYPIASSSVD